MKFGAVAPGEAKGGIVVHSIRKGPLVLRKGTVVGDAEIAALQAAGVASITVARLEPGDVSEDVAAAELAAAVAGAGVHVDRAFTGRANLFAQSAGVVVVDQGGIDRFNEVDEDITLATLAPFAPVVAGKMIATVKIIPFAVGRAARDAALAAARAAAPLVRVAPYAGAQGRRDLDHAAGPRRQGDREDAARHRGAARAGGRKDRRRASGAARDRGAHPRARRGARRRG